jgi:transglutaminase-like putative cysteine protease
MRMTKFPSILAALLALSGPSAAFAQSEQVPVGARPVAMGGAFSAIADDGGALFWNPAGLAQIGHQEVRGTHADLFATGIRDNMISFVLPLSVKQAVAGEWYHSGFDDEELGFNENRISFAYGVTVHPRVHVGGSLKYLNRDTSLDGSTVRKGQGTGVDAGVLALPWRGLRLGLVAQDLFDTSIDDDDGGSGVVYPRNVRVATAWSFGKLGNVAFDVDDRWHLGLEAFPLEPIALRLGVQDDRKGYEHATYAYGAGFKAGIFRVDYAREAHPTLDDTDHFSLALEFNFNPAQVRIERAEAEDIYVSQIKRYAREPFGSITLRNLQEEPLEAQLSVFVPELMETPSVQPILLRPGVGNPIPLTAVFGDRALAIGGDRPVQMEVTASYQSRRLMREDKTQTRFIAYGPGAIHWGAGVDQAAAFVTIGDHAVDALARQASGAVVRGGTEPFGNRNLDFAAAMTDALASIGMAYVPDPTNPYGAISETEHAVDTIHYPHETLESRTGDCDDTTVLMAALLGNVGVPTKLVDVPGHLALLVGTGVHERNRSVLRLDESLYVIDGEEVWIPLETTEVAKGFAHAWKTGAEAYAGWQTRGRVNLVDVAAAQTRFEPVIPPGRREAPTLDEQDLLDRLGADAAIVAGWRREYMDARFGAAPDEAPSEAALAEVARVYFLAGRHDEAARRLEAALESDSASARLLNDLAVVSAARSDLGRAEALLERAASSDASDGGVWLNLGLVRYVQADTLGATEPIAKGLERVGGVDRALGLLGLAGAAAVPGPPAAVSAPAAGEARLLLIEAIERASAPKGSKPQPAGSQAVGKGGTAGAEPRRVRNSAVRAEAASLIHHHLYWKE